MTPVPRLQVVPGDRAVAWRWELAQLELGCRRAWPRPGAGQWALRSRRLAEQLRDGDGEAVLAFDGYTLVGAVWPRADRPVLPCGPFVMPQFRDGALPRRLLSAWLRAGDAASTLDAGARVPLRAVAR